MSQNPLCQAAMQTYRARKTCFKMLEKRGYIVGEEELQLTPEGFAEKFSLGPQDVPPRDNLTIYAEKMEDPDESLFVFFPKAEQQNGEIKKVGVKPIHKCCSQMKENSVSKAILVVEVGITPFARQALEEMKPRYKIEHFKEAELLVDITEHILVPEHQVLTTEEKRELLLRYKLKETQLPRIQPTDPIARYYGLPRFAVVKIIRPSETAGRYVTYRICF